ncbi:MAG TPA: phosphoribosyltransferase family protein [Nitrososphaeraceae archaeon]|nr:phosphoribosyltransferase family protein [Nitrososphaeraceae archaeon]
MKKKIEGTLVEPVVIVDDVLTTGRSIMQAIEAVRNEGKKSVAGVICIIDREIDENLNLLKKNKIKYSPLFRNSEFMPYIERKMNRDLNANLK